MLQRDHHVMTGSCSQGRGNRAVPPDADFTLPESDCPARSRRSIPDDEDRHAESVIVVPVPRVPAGSTDTADRRFVRKIRTGSIPERSDTREWMTDPRNRSQEEPVFCPATHCIPRRPALRPHHGLNSTEELSGSSVQRASVWLQSRSCEQYRHDLPRLSADDRFSG